MFRPAVVCVLIACGSLLGRHSPAWTGAVDRRCSLIPSPPRDGFDPSLLVKHADAIVRARADSATPISGPQFLARKRWSICCAGSDRQRVIEFAGIADVSRPPIWCGRFQLCPSAVPLGTLRWHDGCMLCLCLSTRRRVSAIVARQVDRFTHAILGRVAAHQRAGQRRYRPVGPMGSRSAAEMTAMSNPRLLRAAAQ